MRLIVRRVKPTPGSQFALFAKYEYHPFITDREGPMLDLEADHRHHAEVELVIRDLKDGPWAHMPSGRFGANAAWLALGAVAHNLARWSARLGKITEGTGPIALATLRRRYISVPGHLSRSGRRTTLHLVKDWPWAKAFLVALAALCARGPSARLSLHRHQPSAARAVAAVTRAPPWPREAPGNQKPLAQARSH